VWVLGWLRGRLWPAVLASSCVRVALAEPGVTKPVTEPVTGRATELPTEPVAAPVVEPAMDPVALPATKPAMASVAAPAAASAPAAAAEDRHRLHFAPGFRRFELADYIGTSIVAAGAVVVQFLTRTPVKPRWTGPILFDGAARRAIVASSPAGRNRADLVSDVFWYTPTLLPYVESVLLPLLTDRGNWDVAWQLSAMNLQAAALNWLITRSGHRFIARQRPDVEPCRQNSDYSKVCSARDNASFPSGHVSSGMMGAGLTCAHHGNLPLYGGNAGDIVVCGATVAMALANGVARMAADRHYASDVVAGALVGLGAGLGLPVLLHYGRFGDFSGRGTALWLEPVLSPRLAGLDLRGLL
jgi:membrane-associated phospholipid phosphatase